MIPLDAPDATGGETGSLPSRSGQVSPQTHHQSRLGTEEMIERPFVASLQIHARVVARRSHFLPAQDCTYYRQVLRRPSIGESCADNFELLLLYANKVPCSYSPSNIHAASHHPSVAARDVDQEPVEGSALNNFFRDAPACPIEMKNPGNSSAESREIFFANGEALGLPVAGNDRTAISHYFRDVTRFSTRRRTHVENLFSRLRIKKLAGNGCAWVLNVAMTLSESLSRDVIKFHKMWIAR